MNKFKGRLHIGMVSSSKEPYNYYMIEITEENSGCRAIEVSLSLEDMAKALGSMGVMCEFDFNQSGVIGKYSEHKTEQVVFPRDEYYAKSRPEDLKEIEQILKPYCNNGWEPHIDDAFNGHRMSNGKNGEKLIQISFHRFVDKKPEKSDK